MTIFLFLDGPWLIWRGNSPAAFAINKAFFNKYFVVFLAAAVFSFKQELVFYFFHFPTVQLQPQEISPPPTANLDRSNDKVYENVTGLVKAVIEMSSKIQPAPPEEYVPMVKVMESLLTSSLQYPVQIFVLVAVYGPRESCWHSFIFLFALY